MCMSQMLRGAKSFKAMKYVTDGERRIKELESALSKSTQRVAQLEAALRACMDYLDEIAITEDFEGPQTLLGKILSDARACFAANRGGVK
jgi:hypothetical protein